MTKKEAIIAGRDKIVELIGKDYVMAHKDLCGMWYGHDGDITTVGLGFDEEERDFGPGLSLGKTPFQVIMEVEVNRKTGIITTIT